MSTILFLVPYGASFRKPIESTFKSLDWDILTFDYRKGSWIIRIIRFLPIVGGRQKALSLIDQKIIDLNKKHHPELILTIKAETLENRLFKKLRKSSKPKIVNWFPEHAQYLPLAQKIVSSYDYFFCFEPILYRKLRDLGFNNSHYLPFASEIHKSKNKIKEYDLSFVGTYSQHREEVLSKLTQFNLNIWGDPRWAKSRLKKYVKGGRISQDKMKDIIHKTKININIHYNIINEGANLRNFEVTGCGAFLLSDYVKALGIIFKLNKEIVCYKNSEELIIKINYYLKHEALRERIAKNGFRKARSQNTYLERVTQMLQDVMTSH